MEISKLSKLYAKHPLLYEQHSQKYGQQTALYSVISSEPAIFYISRSSQQSGHASLEPIFNYQGYFIPKRDLRSFKPCPALR